MRTELEVEVIYKWASQNYLIDPTGIAHIIKSCTKKSLVVSTIQQCRLERFEPGDTIVCEGDIPRPEDGHFTVLSGECEIVQFPQDSRLLLKLHALSKMKDKEGVKQLLLKAKVLHRLHKPSGFGELSTSTKVKRTSSVRAAKPHTSNDMNDPSTPRATPAFVELIIIPQKSLLECIDAKQLISEAESRSYAASSEAIDYLRLSGLAHGAAIRDILAAANCITKKSLSRGDILYMKVTHTLKYISKLFIWIEIYIYYKLFHIYYTVSLFSYRVNK